jgi:hypothetical protein
MSAIVASLSLGAAAFSCNTPSVVSRPAVQSAPLAMVAEDVSSSRRQLFARAGAAVFGTAMAQSASAKAGQFGKIGIFGMEDISSPYQPGGPKAGKDATFGYAKSEGEMLANGYESDVTREKKAFEVSSKIVSSQKGNIDSKTWWLVRDNLRGQAYNMKANMLALTNVAPDKAASQKAYTKFWNEINALDLACKKKELALAQKEYGDVLDALAAYTATI